MNTKNIIALAIFSLTVLSVMVYAQAVNQTNSSTANTQAGFSSNTTTSQAPNTSTTTVQPTTTVPIANLTATLVDFPKRLPVGKVSEITVQAIGGEGPYTYQWYETSPKGEITTPALNCIDGSNETTTNSTTAVCQFKPTERGAYYIGVHVTDASNQMFTIDPTVLAGVYANTTVIYGAGSAEFSGNATGAVNNTYYIQWTVNGTYTNGTRACTYKTPSIYSTTGQSTLTLSYESSYPCNWPAGSKGTLNLDEGTYNVSFFAADATNSSDNSTASTQLVVDWPSGIFGNETIQTGQSTVLTVAYEYAWYPSNEPGTYCTSSSGCLPYKHTTFLYKSSSAGTCSTSGPYIASNSTNVTVTPKYDKGPSGDAYYEESNFTVSPASNTVYCAQTEYFLQNGQLEQSNISTESPVTATIDVKSAPPIGLGAPNVIVPNSVIDVGQSEIITANVIGGTGTYTNFVWTVNGVTLNQHTQSITFTGNTSNVGTDPISVTVTDSANQVATGTGTVKVNTALGFGTPQVTVPNSIIEVGQTESITANVAGGTTPYTNFVWTVNGVTLNQHTQSITFTGNTSNVGTDAISVTVTDSANQHATGTGTVTVHPALGFGTPSVVIPNSVIDVGQSETITANVVGGISPYTYSWTVNNAPVSGTTNTITFTATNALIGTDTVKVTVTDSANSMATATGTVKVDSTLTFGTPQVTVPNSVIDVGQSETITANVIGGTGTYTNFNWVIDGIAQSGHTQSISFAPTNSYLGTDQIQVTVTDSANSMATGTGTVTVDQALGFGTPSVAIPNSIIDVGQSETITANAVGGTGTYTYTWTLNGITLGQTSKSITFNGNTSDIGVDHLQVTVKDSSGQTASATGTVTVDSELTIGAPQPAYQTIDQNQSATITENAPTTGTSPYTYQWLVETPGNSLYISANGYCVPANTATCNFPTTANTPTGPYNFEVKVIDAAGESATSSVAQVQVNPALTVPPPVIDPFDIGQTITVNYAGISTGTPPYTYTWSYEEPGSASYTVDTSACTPPGSPASNAIESGISCTFVTNNAMPAGRYTFKLTVTDSKGVTSNSVGSTQVNATPRVTLTASSPTVQINSQETLTANVFDGTGPFTVNVFNQAGTMVDTSAVVPYNGYLRYTFTANTLGTFTYSVTATDTGTTLPDSAGTAYATFNVVAPSTTVTITPNTVNATIGTPVTFNATVTGGMGPYTYNWLIGTNTISSCPSLVTSSNTATCTFTTTNTGISIVSITVTPSAGNTVTTTATLTVKNAPLTITISPSNASIDTGQSVTFTNTTTGGVPPYIQFGYQVYNSTSNTFVGSNALLAASGITVSGNTLTFGNSGTFTVREFADDSGTNESYSNNATIIVTTPTTTTGGGGGGSSGGGGGGGGPALPTVTSVGACDQISSFTQLNSVVFKLDGVSFTVVENFITPTSAGISVNGKAYTINNGSTISLGTISNVNFTATLKSISYLPIEQTITLDVCGPSSSSKNTTTGPNTNNTGVVLIHIYPNSTINVTSTRGTDTVALLVDNSTVSTGTGTLLYNGLALVPGNYTLQGKDLDTGIASDTLNFTRGKYSALLEFTRICANQTVSSNTFSCTTSAHVFSINNQVIATLYVNGKLIGSTTSTINSTENSLGTYSYVFNTTGNADYTAESVHYKYTASASSNGSSGAAKLATTSALSGAVLPVIIAAIIAAIAGIVYAGTRRRRKQQAQQAQ